MAPLRCLVFGAVLGQICIATDILVAGDSWAVGLGTMLPQACTGKTVVNMGVTGSTASVWGTHDILGLPCPDKPHEKCSAIALNALSPVYGSGYKHIWLSVGGNDFLLTRCSHSRMKPMFNLIQSALLAVKNSAPEGVEILMTGYPVMSHPLVAFAGTACVTPSDFNPFQDTIKAACESVQGCTFIDITSALGGSRSTYSELLYYTDDVHVSQEGILKIVKMPEIQKFFGCPGSEEANEERVSFLQRRK
jgi:hypothetical protein